MASQVEERHQVDERHQVEHILSQLEHQYEDGALPKFDHNMISQSMKYFTDIDLQQIKENPPSDRTGYMFTSDKTLSTIMDKVEQGYPGHSGCSIGLTMRAIQYIVTHGVEKYCNRDENDEDDEDDDGNSISIIDITHLDK